ncbi:hypothetical protein T4C_2236 [Trichinella pseudospiralis]|uniref:Uncharacterized protein n=1 Tax=Trichinella pseudospiralis TaxID=6337 RepID=A0A0V1J9Z8_TRIPS|nr:hypothetical protein T4C_2236 [Trichinella pseudospiralis]
MQIWANSNRVYMLCDQRLRRVTAVDVKETIFSVELYSEQQNEENITKRFVIRNMRSNKDENSVFAMRIAFMFGMATVKYSFKQTVLVK